jgi:hypothetical protein
MLDNILKQLSELRLHGISDTIEQRLSQAYESKLSYEDLLLIVKFHKVMVVFSKNAKSCRSIIVKS